MKRVVSLLVGSLLVFSLSYIRAELVTTNNPDQTGLAKDIKECIKNSTVTPDIDKIKLAVIFCKLGHRALDHKLYKQAASYFKRSLVLVPEYNKSKTGLKLAEFKQNIGNLVITMKKTDNNNLSKE